MFFIQLYRSKKTLLWRRFWLTTIFFLLLFFSMPLLAQDDGPMSGFGGTLWAQDVNQELGQEVIGEAPETKPCSSCHSEEAEAWQRSLHANQITASPAASCTDCHGEYVRGHPDEGMIPLVVDSTNCGTCHADTYDQWTHSLHAAEGVQCISCHKSHDQELRLTDEALCNSCHRESVDDPLHSAHWQGDVACTSCHLTDSPNQNSVASSVPFLAVTMAPSHDFVTVSAAKCLDCHRNDVLLTDSANGDVSNVAVQAIDDPAQTTQPAPELTSKLATAEKSNQFLTVLSTVNLGFGIGIGGILGMLFVLVGTAINKKGGKA